jgi:hypothetical protein
MVKSLIGILPWAIVLALGGAVIWFLLDRQMAAGLWLLALLLAAHGMVHVLFVVPAPAPPAGRGGHEWPFDLARSWLATRAGLAARHIRWVAMALIGLTITAFVIAALATIGLIVPTDWWGGLVVLGAAASLVLLIVAFDPQLLLGIGIDIVLLSVALGSLWSPAAA